jgi:methionyl-tRNA formyltransferase
VISGERESGVTIFRPDVGVDTGPIVVQRGGVEITTDDTVGSLYFNHLYALGVEAMVEAVTAVDEGSAQYEAQDESKATSQGLVGEAEAHVDWSRSAVEIDRQVRGCDPQPGGHAELEGETVRLFDCRLVEEERSEPPGTLLGFVEEKMLISARGGTLSVGWVRVGEGKKVAVAESGLEPGSKLS